MQMAVRSAWSQLGRGGLSQGSGTVAMVFGRGGGLWSVSEERILGGTSLEREVHSLFPLILRSQQNLERNIPGKQKLMNLGQDGVGKPWSLREADRTGKTGPGRVVSWKKRSQPEKELGGCGADGKDVLKSSCGLRIKSGPDTPPATHTPCMLELCKGDPLLFPRQRWVPRRELGPDCLGLRGMAGPEPGASSGHPQPAPPPPLSLASAETSRPELGWSQPQQGVGPGPLKEGQGQSQVQAAENKREKGSYPARPPEPPAGPRDKGHSWPVYFGT